MPAEQPHPIIFDTAADFRAWLEANHDSARELWVGYYKKGTGKSSMTYAEAVEEGVELLTARGAVAVVDDRLRVRDRVRCGARRALRCCSSMSTTSRQSTTPTGIR